MSKIDAAGNSNSHSIDKAFGLRERCKDLEPKTWTLKLIEPRNPSKNSLRPASPRCALLKPAFIVKGLWSGTSFLFSGHGFDAPHRQQESKKVPTAAAFVGSPYDFHPKPRTYERLHRVPWDDLSSSTLPPSILHFSGPSGVRYLRRSVLL